MRYEDCEIGMKVITDDGKRGTVVRLAPITRIAHPDPAVPRYAFNMAAVEFDPPYEQTPAGPLKGTLIDPTLIQRVQ